MEYPAGKGLHVFVHTLSTSQDANDVFHSLLPLFALRHHCCISSSSSPACVLMKRAPNKLLLTLPQRCLVNACVFPYRSNKVLLEKLHMTLIHSSHTSHVISCCAAQRLTQSPSPTIYFLESSDSAVLACLFVCLLIGSRSPRTQ